MKPRDTPPTEAPPVRPPGVHEDAILKIYRVPGECAGMRLDVFMRTQLRNTSRTRARAIIEQSAHAVDGRALRANDRVKADERIALWRAPFEEVDDVPLPIVYEDPHLLAIDKPPLVTVHPTARYHRNTVIERLRAARPGEFLALIHRIDRETSGVLMLAKHIESERAFKRLLEERSLGGEDSVKKTYVAVTHGVPPSSFCELPVELDTENSLRVKMRIAEPGQGLSARTGIDVFDAHAGYAMCRMSLHTGRQHQIRLHLSALGCPVVGDKLYGPDERLLARAADGELTEEDLVLLEHPRQLLHAERYDFTHPMTGEPLGLVAPLPQDMADFWQSRRP
ncbi:MAG: Ribosomal large subunit pseudouridine synthase [Polyangiaceae bacterium]|jgi:23S rRNA pseudouridine1911/1915/1917 synthase|nr:Ribosomal large subunit pseudouridine synthase [Polyangiaceae bacterium]